MGFWSDYIAKAMEDGRQYNAIKDAQLAETNRLHREQLWNEFPFKASRPVTPGLYYVVSHSHLKSRGLFRWRMTAGRGFDSFTIDFLDVLIMHRKKGTGFTHNMTRIYQEVGPVNTHYNSSAPIGNLIELTATHAIPRDITRQESENRHPKI